MRIAVISDVHAEAARLEQALAAIEGRSPDQIWCLGDSVGLGSEPGAVVAAIRERCDLVLAGAYDLAAGYRLDSFYDALAPPLRRSIDLAREQLSPDGLDWLAGLPAVDRYDGVDAVFGALPHPKTGFLSEQDPELARTHFRMQEGSLSLFGLTHRALALSEADGELEAVEPADGERIELAEDRRWALNPGSCGVPQAEGLADRRPGWMLLEPEERWCSWHRLDG
jgi:hypothetical protein